MTKLCKNSRSIDMKLQLQMIEAEELDVCGSLILSHKIM